MGKQPNSKTRRPESFGKGKVTPIQIAFIVYRYLCDNNFSETRAAFRNEASSLIANSPIHEAPKSLLSLGEMLDEYICLKEQKVMVEQERVHVEQEKNRVQMLLQGMQNAMNVYNASPGLVAPRSAAVAAVPQLNCSNRTPPTGVSTTKQTTSNAHSLLQPIHTNAEIGNFSTPVVNVSNRKRKDTITVDAPSAAKKSRGKLSNKKVPLQGQNTLPQSRSAASNEVFAQPSSAATHSSPGSCIPGGLQVQGSTVVKCLFNQPSLTDPGTTSPVPETPILTNSSHSDTHIDISPTGTSPVSNHNGEASRTCYTVISSKRIMVSPTKQMAYIEKSQSISPIKTGCKRDHVRSRLDFGASDMPGSSDKSLPAEISAAESAKSVDLFDIDFPNLDALGMDFSFNELFSDIEIPCDGVDFSYHPASSHPKDNASGSPQECKENQVISELSTVGEVLSEKDMNIQGPGCLNATKSVTKSIMILSPVKSRQGYLDQEN